MKGIKMKRLVSVLTVVGISVQFLGLNASADDVPYFCLTNGCSLQTNAANRAFNEAPDPPNGPPQMPASPSAAASFPAFGDDGNPLTPPDVMGAVGPNHLVVMHNQGVRVLNRSGSTVYSTESLSNWWARGISGFHFVFDPKVVYDPYNDR